MSAAVVTAVSAGGGNDKVTHSGKAVDGLMYQTELIYVTDENEVKESDKELGLKCPNCGSPIKSLGEKKCPYCRTGLVDLAKRVWYLNSIENK